MAKYGNADSVPVSETATGVFTHYPGMCFINPSSTTTNSLSDQKVTEFYSAVGCVGGYFQVSVSNPLLEDIESDSNQTIKQDIPTLGIKLDAIFDSNVSLSLSSNELLKLTYEKELIVPDQVNCDGLSLTEKNNVLFAPAGVQVLDLMSM